MLLGGHRSCCWLMALTVGLITVSIWLITVTVGLITVTVCSSVCLQTLSLIWETSRGHPWRCCCGGRPLQTAYRLCGV